MCRLLAFSSADDTTIQELLTPREFENYRQLSTLHSDGWGASWWSRDLGVRQTNSVLRAVDDPNFLNVSTEQSMSAGIVHLRWATSGLSVCMENTHPFTSPEWRFAHNGAIKDPERLLNFLSPARRAALVGTTDSEIYFQLVLEKTQQTGDIRAGLREAIRLIRQTCGLGSLNCLVLGEGRMLAVQAIGDTPAPVDSLVQSVGPTQSLPEGHDENYYHLRLVVRDGHVIVASTGVGVDGWQMLGDDAILDVDVAAARAQVRGLGDDSIIRTIDLRESAIP